MYLKNEKGTGSYFYETIVLTPEEEKEAILQGKIKKYFRIKHAPYWEEQEKKKPNGKDKETKRVPH